MSSSSVPTKEAPKPVETRILLMSAMGAFGAGLMGAIWHTKRKQARDIAIEEAAEITQPPRTQQAGPAIRKPMPPRHIAHAPVAAYKPPTMTAAEYAIAKQDAGVFAFKTLAYGTLLAWGTAGVLALSVGYFLEVRNFKEFSDKLQIIVPRQTSRLRKALGGTSFEMREEETQELDALVLED
ncbi:hypothetical protein J3Q64DRAFT_1828002 [Phycomyces blakesleeanus]